MLDFLLAPLSFFSIFLHSGLQIQAPYNRRGVERCGGEPLKLNIPLSVIGSICCAGTDCSILLLCWRAVYLSSLLPSLTLSPPPSFSPFPIIAIWHSPLHCQSGQQGGSDDLFVPYIPVPASPAEAYDLSSWIKYDGLPMWPL